MIAGVEGFAAGGRGRALRGAASIPTADPAITIAPRSAMMMRDVA